MTLSQATLAALLERPFIFKQTVASSNDDAQAWLRSGAEAGSAIIADEQTAGRGRRGRIWYTPPGVALAVSVILKPPRDVASRASIVGALAVHDLCASLQIPAVGIKWPNDVQIDGKKVSGILPEAVWDADRLLGVVLGIGVNVRVDFAPDVAPLAINLESAAGRTLNRAQLAATLLERVDYWSDHIFDPMLLDTWRERLVTLGQTVRVESAAGVVVGQAQAVNDDGALLIELPDGRIQRVLAGDVSIRPTQAE